MDIQARKLDLVEKIIHTEKTSVLVKIKDLLQREKADDWWEDLPVEIQDSIVEGLQDIKERKVLSHVEVMMDAKQKYGF